jgi:hypothetical protein
MQQRNEVPPPLCCISVVGFADAGMPRILPSRPTPPVTQFAPGSQPLCSLLGGSGSLLVVFSYLLLDSVQKLVTSLSKIDYELQDFARSVRPCPIPGFILSKLGAYPMQASDPYRSRAGLCARHYASGRSDRRKDARARLWILAIGDAGNIG